VEKLSNEDRHTKKLNTCPAKVCCCWFEKLSVDAKRSGKKVVVCRTNDCLPMNREEELRNCQSMNLLFVFLSVSDKVFVHRERNVADLFVCQQCETVISERTAFAIDEINLLLSRHTPNDKLSNPAIVF